MSAFPYSSHEKLYFYLLMLMVLLPLVLQAQPKRNMVAEKYILQELQKSARARGDTLQINRELSKEEKRARDKVRLEESRRRKIIWIVWWMFFIRNWIYQV